MFTVPSEKEEKHLRERGVSIPKKENIGRNATSEEVENSGSVPTEKEGLTIPSKGQMKHPVVGGIQEVYPQRKRDLRFPRRKKWNTL